MVQKRKKPPAMRQRVRNALLIFSFILMPVTFIYISCPIVHEGASQGIATGGMIVFSLLFVGALFVGRSWCGYLCPAGGLQEIYSRLNGRSVRGGRLDWFKYLVFLGVFVPLILAVFTAGGISSIDLLYSTDHGISIAKEGTYAIFYAQILFISLFALVAGRRGFCHYFCPIAVIMILGRKIRNLFGWPALHLSADPDLCTDCTACSNACPMSLDVNRMVRDDSMENAECILCANCADICPQGVIRTAWLSPAKKL
ncbi:MAG: 4Fe-4S binding protein [Methanomicrobiaceae archaeon]|nr:4Fe-4S binding protein [Methanomicrobiaceae archaeon]